MARYFTDQFRRDCVAVAVVLCWLISLSMGVGMVYWIGREVLAWLLG